MSNRDKAFILFHRPDFGLDQAETLLRDRGLTVTSDGKRLLLQWGDGPLLVLEHFQGPGVQQQIARLATGTPHVAATNTFDALFQITFDELDDVLEEINTLIEVQATLEQATDGFLYTTWNGQWAEPKA